MNDDIPFQKYLAGGVVSLLAKVIGILSGFGSLWFLTSILQQEGYGGYTTGLTVAALIALLSQLGFKNTIIQKIAENNTDKSTSNRYWGAIAFWSGSVSIALVIIVWLVSPTILSIIGSSKELNFWIQFGGGLIPAITLRAIQAGKLRGHELIPQAILFEQILPSLLRIIGLSIVYFLYPASEGVVLVIYISYYLPSAILVIIDRQWKYLNLTGINIKQLQLAASFLSNSIASRLLTNVDIILLTSLAGLAATGSYQVAWKLSLVSRYVDDALTNVIAPRYSRFISNSEYRKLQRELNLVREVSLIGGSVIVLVVLLFGKALLGVFGNYQDQYSTLVLLSVGGGLLNPANGPVGQILLMSKKGKLILLVSLLTLCLNIIGNILLIPEFGALGASISTVITLYLLNGIFSMVFIYYSLNVNVFEFRIALPVTIVVLFILGTLFLDLPIWMPSLGLGLISIYYIKKHIDQFHSQILNLILRIKNIYMSD